MGGGGTFHKSAPELKYIRKKLYTSLLILIFTIIMFFRSKVPLWRNLRPQYRKRPEASTRKGTNRVNLKINFTICWGFNM